jgi:hypothetical protein
MNLRLLTVRQVMERTNLPRSAVYALAKSGEVQSMKGVIGRAGRTANLLISEVSLIEWQARRLQGHPVTPLRVLDADASLPPVKDPAFH